MGALFPGRAFDTRPGRGFAGHDQRARLKSAQVRFEEALEAIRTRPPGLVLLDVKLPGMSGLEALAEIRKTATPLPVLLLTAHADLRQAVSAMKTGADDYLAKPVDLEELKTAVFDLLGRFEEDLDQPDDPTALPPGVVCESPAMRSVVRTVMSVARSDASVLVLGEGRGRRLPVDTCRLQPRWADGGSRSRGGNPRDRKAVLRGLGPAGVRLVRQLAQEFADLGGLDDPWQKGSGRMSGVLRDALARRRLRSATGSWPRPDLALPASLQ